MAAEEAEKSGASKQLTEEEAIEQGYTIIKTPQQLIAIAENLSGKYILMNDIDLAGIDWVPIGNNENPFAGILNGNGYSVKNLTINVDDGTDTNNVGFFGVTDGATISDISFEDANITTPDTYNQGSVGIVAGTSKGTTFENVNVSGDVTGHQKVGGVVGTIADYVTEDENGEVTVHNSSFTNVNSNVNINSSYYAGGIVGYVNSTYSNDLVFDNCSASGNVTVSEKCAGGFIGEAGSTIITINNSTSNVNLTCDNSDNTNELTWLQETARVGGFIGCANGTNIAFCNSEYNGTITADGEFQGDYYGYYMNDAHVTIFELEAGLPADDILNIEGVDGMNAIVDPETGETRYEVTVSTLTGLDKLVALIRNNPKLADLITFNINFDFESMDEEHNATTAYNQYGVVQHIYEETDENGNTTVVNDVYIDNEIDLESTFNVGFTQGQPTSQSDILVYIPTMVDGLYKDNEGNYYVERHGEFIRVSLEFFFENQRTDITKRLEDDEVSFRNRITMMVYFYQQKMQQALIAKYGLPEDTIAPIIDEPEYKYLKQLLESGAELSSSQLLAIDVYELNYKIMEIVGEATHNEGCGMGGDASFLEETTGIPMTDEDGRIRYTTLSGLELRQCMDEEGNLMFDEDGEPLYETLDGEEYLGLDEVFVVRGYPKTDEEGNMLYTDSEGNTVIKNEDENGNVTYSYEDGSSYEGSEEDLSQQLEEYSIPDEYKGIEDQMKDLLDEIENGGTPSEADSAQAKNEASAAAGAEVSSGVQEAKIDVAVQNMTEKSESLEEQDLEVSEILEELTDTDKKKLL